jgi:putative transposase
MECLGQYWFLDLDDARQKVESWRVEYNEVKPHSAIGDRTPMSLIRLPLEQSEA